MDLAPVEGVIRCDLSKPLPIASGNVDLIYSEHFIEHLTLPQAEQLLSECHRVLEAGGGIRVSTPDLQKLIASYQTGRVDEWKDVDWEPATPCQLLNEGLHSWGHQFVFDAVELRSLLQRTGFVEARRMKWGQSSCPDLAGLESRPDHEDLIIEAVRP
jgi:predicted SAM-dependent methyltransferase